MRKILSLFLVIGLVACDSSLTGLSSEVQGTYTLHSINGQRMPYVLEYDGYRETVIYSGTLRMESGGRFTETVQLEVSEPGRVSQSTDRYTGTYTVRSSGALSLRYDDGEIIDGDYNGGDITLYGFGQTVLYRR